MSDYSSDSSSSSRDEYRKSKSGKSKVILNGISNYPEYEMSLQTKLLKMDCLEVIWPNDDRIYDKDITACLHHEPYRRAALCTHNNKHRVACIYPIPRWHAEIIIGETKEEEEDEEEGEEATVTTEVTEFTSSKKIKYSRQSFQKVS